MSRIVVLVGVLLVMLLVPLVLNKERNRRMGDKAGATDAAERAVDARAVQAASAARQRDPDRLGLTYGWLPASSADELRAACRGLPPLMADGVMRDCGLARGDTSCRTVLPLLCLREAEGDQPRALATAEAVAGFVIDSRADADARCARALGPGWRMAEYEDGEQGELRVRPAAADTRARVWTATRSPGPHCWDPV
jgi:hypothetical protein